MAEPAWPVKSPQTDAAAATIQQAVRRRAMKDGLSTTYRLERALFAGPSPDGDDINQHVDVAAHAQELTGAVKNALARIAKQRQAQLRSLAAPLLPGGDAAAAQLAEALERYHRHKEEELLGALRQEGEERMRRVATAARRDVQEQLRSQKRQEDARTERVRRIAAAEVAQARDAARNAAQQAEAAWAARLDDAAEENAELCARLQSSESVLARRKSEVEQHQEVAEGAAAALRRQCGLLEKQLRRAESRTATQQRERLVAEKEATELKRRVAALESSTAAAWAASFAATQRAGGATSTKTAVTSLPSPSQLSASSRSRTISGTSQPPRRAARPPASPPRWRRDRFQIDTAATLSRSYAPPSLAQPSSLVSQICWWVVWIQALGAIGYVSCLVDVVIPLAVSPEVLLPRLDSRVYD